MRLWEFQKGISLYIFEVRTMVISPFSTRVGCLTYIKTIVSLTHTQLTDIQINTVLCYIVAFEVQLDSLPSSRIK